jgi:hypothetical protein
VSVAEKKQLTGRLLQIARGESRLGLDRVNAYRQMWSEQGYDLPELLLLTGTDGQHQRQPGSERN